MNKVLRVIRLSFIVSLALIMHVYAQSNPEAQKIIETQNEVLLKIQKKVLFKNERLQPKLSLLEVQHEDLDPAYLQFELRYRAPDSKKIKVEVLSLNVMNYERGVTKERHRISDTLEINSESSYVDINDVDTKSVYKEYMPSKDAPFLATDFRIVLTFNVKTMPKIRLLKQEFLIKMKNYPVDGGKQ